MIDMNLPQNNKDRNIGRERTKKNELTLIFAYTGTYKIPAADGIHRWTICHLMIPALHTAGGNLQFSGHRTITDWILTRKRQRQPNGTPGYDPELTLGPRRHFDISAGQL